MRTDIIFHIIQNRVITVCDDAATYPLEFLDVIDHLAAEEGCAILKCNIYVDTEQGKTTARKLSEYYREREKYNSRFTVEGVIKNYPKMLYILSGYKPYLWDDVVERVKLFKTDDMDFCVASSGKYGEELSDLCKKMIGYI